jgi:phosphatidylglycerophosphatase A
MTNDPAAHPAEQRSPEGGGGFNPRISPTESTRALAPEQRSQQVPADAPTVCAPSIPTRKKTLWAWTIATFFGAGFGRPGPGTWGSVAAVLLWAAYAWLTHPAPHTLLFALLAGIALTLLFGIPAATVVARESGRKDPQCVIIDEVAGQWIALLFTPFDLRNALLALLLFRLFDIVKPFPIRRLEILPGGWGIVLDDVAAGLYALGVASLLRLWI